jgi:hypothetical protein
VSAVIVVHLPVASGLPARAIKGENPHGNNIFCKTAASHIGAYPARDTRVWKAKLDTLVRRLILCGGYRVHRMKAHTPIYGMGR